MQTKLREGLNPYLLQKDILVFSRESFYFGKRSEDMTVEDVEKLCEQIPSKTKRERVKRGFRAFLAIEEEKRELEIREWAKRNPLCLRREPKGFK